MNAKSFFQALRTVIREEVQAAVREELQSVLTEQKLAKVTVDKKPAVASNKTVNRSTRSYSANPMLNEILNETGGFKPESKAVELHESIDFASMHNDMSEWPDLDMRKIAMKPSLNVLKDIHGNQISANDLSKTEAGSAVLNAITKDYSSLMKAIDKKKGL